jgi:Tfp pilus assembly protein PilN
MKAVNLIPKESRSNRAIKTGKLGLSHGVVGVLLIAVAFVAVYVLENNTISDRQAKLTTLHAEVNQEQALAASLTQYTSFEQQAQQRVGTVRTIIASRFDWQNTLTDLSRVVPSGTHLTSLTGTIVPSASAGGAGGGSGGGLRAAINAPAFELVGCTGSQDDVANLMSRLRLINGVTRVTLNTSNRTFLNGALLGLKTASASTGTTGSTGLVGIASCGASPTAFDLVVFFIPIPNAGPTGIAADGATGATGVAGAPTTGQPANNTSSTGGSQ